MEFRLLGPLEVHDGTSALPLGGRRQRTLLAHLLVRAGTPSTVDRLVEEVWGEDTPASARASLHTYVSRLRTLVGPDRLETRSDGYLLHVGSGELDAVSFSADLAAARALRDTHPVRAVQRYDAALARWRGAALGDLADHPSLQPEAARLDALRTSAVEERIGARLDAGEAASLVPELEDLLARDPLREDLWGHLVLALYRSDRQADALLACDRARRVLQRELGVEPSERLRRLQVQVLQQVPELSCPGTRLHGYVLLDLLAEDGTGTVHRALQPHVGREVALRTVAAGLADAPALVARFEAEARTAALIEHPHVVPLYDSWREPGAAYLATRLLRGGTVADLVAARPPVARVLRVATQVAAGLDACARAGLVHSALHAADVELDEDGNAYVPALPLVREVLPAGGASGLPPRSAPDAPRRPDVPALAALVAELLGCASDRPTDLPDPLRHPERYPDAGSLVAALAPIVPGQRQPEAAPPHEVRNPYKGLRPFSESDAADFRGRDRLTARLVARLVDDDLRLLVVVGPSGSGKSSVVRAGIVPALRARLGCYVAELVPGNDPFAELLTALRRVAVTPLTRSAADVLLARPEGLSALAAAVLPDDAGELVLVVDQFEELFTLTPPGERRRFIDALVAAATAPVCRVRTVLTLRADFYDRPLAEPGLAELVQAGTEVVVPLDRDELRAAVVEPAEHAGLSVEPALVDEVVRDVVDAPGGLPLLQYALTELVDRRSSATLTLSGYRDVGGVAGALVRRAERVHAELSPMQRAVARQLLLQLVQSGEGGSDTRRRVLLSQLVSRTVDPDAALTVVEAFGAARLLAFDRDPVSRAPTVEVAHEALLREWTVLREWLEAVRENLRTERRLAAAAREWQEAGRDPSFLATGSRLEALDRWQRAWQHTAGWRPDELEASYLDASLAAARDAAQAEDDRRRYERELERRSVRRLRGAVAVLAVAVLAATSLTVFGFNQRELAQRQSALAEARALAAAALAVLGDDAERGVLLALEAVTRGEASGDVLPEAEEALHRSLVALRLVRTVEGIGGHVDWSVTGLLATEGPEGSGSIDVRDAAGRRVREWRGHEVDVNAVAFSPDGARLLTTGDDGAARLWEPSTGRMVWEHDGDGQVWGPSFSADGQTFAAAWLEEGVVRVVSTATGAVRATLFSPAPAATSVAADGRVVAVASRQSEEVELLEVATGRTTLAVALPSSPVHDVDISPDGRWLAVSGLTGAVQVRALPDGRLHGTLWTSSSVNALDWAPGSDRVVVAGDDGVGRIFEISDDGVREGLRLTSSRVQGSTGAAFAPDGEHVALGDFTTEVVQLWDVSPSGSAEWLTVPVPARQVVGADVVQDGRHLVVSAADGGAAVHDATSGALLRALPPQPGGVRLLRASPDGRLVSGLAGDGVHVWDVTTGDERFAIGSRDATGHAWSDDGSRLAVAAGTAPVTVVDRDGALVAELAVPAGTGAVGVDLSADGRRVFGALVAVPDAVRRHAGTGQVVVWDVETGDVVRRLDGDAETLAASPDGRLLAVAASSGPVTVWDVAAGRKRSVLWGHVGPVWDLDLSADGSTLLSAGQDGTVRVWDLQRHELRLTLRGHTSVVTSARFSPDGTQVVSASTDGTARVWATHLPDLVAIAEARVTRRLTDDECRLYLGDPC